MIKLKHNNLAKLENEADINVGNGAMVKVCICVSIHFMWHCKLPTSIQLSIYDNLRAFCEEQVTWWFSHLITDSC